MGSVELAFGAHLGHFAIRRWVTEQGEIYDARSKSDRRNPKGQSFVKVQM
jgi:hypothetical protein